MNRALVAADVRRPKILVQNEVRASSRRLLQFTVGMRGSKKVEAAYGPSGVIRR
jgi:hypothetical protein